MWCVCVCVYIFVCVHTHTQIHTMECYSAIKKNEFLPFVITCMDLEGIIFIEISQKEKDGYYMLPLI